MLGRQGGIYGQEEGSISLALLVRRAEEDLEDVVEVQPRVRATGVARVLGRGGGCHALGGEEEVVQSAQVQLNFLWGVSLCTFILVVVRQGY
jgi:hypothetical protein